MIKPSRRLQTIYNSADATSGLCLVHCLILTGERATRQRTASPFSGLASLIWLRKARRSGLSCIAYGVIRTAGDRGDRGAVQLALTISRVLAGQGSMEKLQMTPPYRCSWLI